VIPLIIATGCREREFDRPGSTVYTHGQMSAVPQNDKAIYRFDNIFVIATVDDLILNLIENERLASGAELATILAHVAQAPFATYLAQVPNNMRHLLLGRGQRLPLKFSSLDIHLLKRIQEDQQWPIGTTPLQYVQDLHWVIAHPDVQVWTYRYFAQPFIGFMAPSHVQMVARPEQYIFVAYSPQYSTLTTGYQANSKDTVFTAGYTNVLQQR
jgi:hypothetical protein